MSHPSVGTKRLNRALQGGGSHGAFTWGVLDRILADERIGIEAVTGASAGAMNAVALAEGMATGDREVLWTFWSRVSSASQTSFSQRSPLDMLMGSWNLDFSPGYIWFDAISRTASPYDLNPTNWNPLRNLLNEMIHFDEVRESPLEVFIAAPNVRSGQGHVFLKEELSADHVIASACLPFLFQAVEIDGAAYWDGGYMGNPPLWPLFDCADSDDIVLVQINPLTVEKVPHTAREIADRLNEITFNASLLRELRAIDLVTRLLEDGRLEGTGYRRVLMHWIGDEAVFSRLGASSKLNAEWGFLEMLHEAGRAAADRWIHDHYDDLGARASVNLRKIFQGERDGLNGSRIRLKKRGGLPRKKTGA
jgi:NTE family protein